MKLRKSPIVTFLILAFLAPVVALAQAAGGGAGVEVEPDLVDIAVTVLGGVVTALGGLVVIATAIAPITKTTRDDEIAGWLRRAVDRLSLLRDRVK